MPQPSVLIVGAGAVGVVVGYHLSLGGTAVTFYVRPSRVAAMHAPQRLYCYDDGTIKEYANYAVISTANEVEPQQFDFVLFTPDGAACHSPEGTQLLRELGAAILNTTAVMIMCAVGIGLREHILAATGLPEERLLEGTLGNVGHQASAEMIQHPPTYPALVASASIAYRHFSGKVGFMLVPEPRATAQRFISLYDRCGVSRCVPTNAAMYRIYTNAFFAFTLSAELAGWPDVAGLAANRRVMARCIGAMREIAGLPRFGWTGRIMRLLLSQTLLMAILRKVERDFLPLDFMTFNRFHHGVKVLAQDVEVLRNCLNEGRAHGRAMSSLDDLLRQFELHGKKM